MNGYIFSFFSPFFVLFEYINRRPIVVVIAIIRVKLSSSVEYRLLYIITPTAQKLLNNLPKKKLL